MIKELGKTIVILIVAAGLAIALFKSPSDGAKSGGGGLGNSLSNLFGAPTEPKKPAKEREPEPTGSDGVVIEHRDGALLILPFDGDPFEVDATARQLRHCPVDARYPDCL